MPARELGRFPHRTAVDVPGHAVHVLRISITPRRCHFRKHAELSGNHQVPGRSCCKHKPAAARRMLKRELLRERTAPRDAEHVGLRMTELVEQARGRLRQHPRPVRQSRRGRAADAGNVERDDLGAFQRFEKRLDELDVRADAVEEKQGRSRVVAGPHPDAQCASRDLAQADLHHFSIT
jgi:hypothetical protein